MVLAPFAETKGARLPGRTPATQKITVIWEFSTTEALIYRPTLLNWTISKYISNKHDAAVWPEFAYDLKIPAWKLY